jgi:hypothetical protein
MFRNAMENFLLTLARYFSPSWGNLRKIINVLSKYKCKPEIICLPLLCEKQAETDVLNRGDFLFISVSIHPL